MGRRVTVAPRRSTVVVAALVVSVALVGCGGSAVAPRTYVRSVCVALGNWRNTIQSAGVALQSSGAASAPRPAAKLDYQRFVSALVFATRRATRALRSAGVPSVAGGKKIAGRLAGAFERATQGLAAASSQAAAMGTGSSAQFASGATAVNSRIRSALEQIAHVSPGQNRQLRSAADRESACRLLAG